MTFKKGDKVKVKTSLLVNTEYGKVVFVPNMEIFKGKEIEIKEVLPQGIYFSYGNIFAWSEEMLVGGSEIDRSYGGKELDGDDNFEPNDNVIVSGNDKSNSNSEDDNIEDGDSQEESSKTLKELGFSLPKPKNDKKDDDNKGKNSSNDSNKNSEEDSEESKSKSKPKNKSKSKKDNSKSKSEDDDSSNSEDDSSNSDDDKEKSDEKSEDSKESSKEKEESKDSNDDSNSQSQSQTPPKPPTYWVKYYLEQFNNTTDEISNNEIERISLLNKALDVSGYERSDNN
jgi:hypothetical protein